MRSRETYCLVRTGTAPSLERFSRALASLGFRTFESEYDFPFTAMTHAVFMTTTAIWGDGSRKAVQTYAGYADYEAKTTREIPVVILAPSAD